METISDIHDLYIYMNYQFLESTLMDHFNGKTLNILPGRICLIGLRIEMIFFLDKDFVIFCNQFDMLFYKQNTEYFV